ncbi:GIY-YIG nuclease family protein [Acinetobacter sp.]|uniref:GIY-YIG nuclease family protein n=1 Tax=Acinetobacter sp. TaxID=472 RepID=UPI00388DB484
MKKQQRADKRKYHYVYQINRIDGKFYIGLHSTDNLDDGYFGSGTYLTNSLRYHGKEKHTKIILAFFETRKEAKDYEKLLITDEMRFTNKMCMNIAPGGGGGFINEAHKIKFVNKASEAAKLGHMLHPSGSEVAKSRTAAAQETVKIRKSLGKNYVIPSFAGRQHTVESKTAIGEKNSIHQNGKNNSQFGKCWVTNDIESKSINKIYLDEYLAKGFRKGRKIKF